MKNVFWGTALLCMALTCVTACGGDDEPTPGTDLPQVRNAGGWTFLYDANDAFEGFMLEGNVYQRNGNTLQFKELEQDGDENEEYHYTVTLNDRNLISTIEYSFRERDDRSEGRGQGKLVYGYDKQRQMTGYRLLTQYEVRESENGRRVKSIVNKGDASETLVWQDGLLTGYTITTKTNEEFQTYGTGEWTSGNETSTKTETGTFDYGQVPNTKRQLPYVLCGSVLTDEGLPMLALVGLYGTGPTFLPTSGSYTCVADDGNGGTKTEQRQTEYTFLLNDDGTLKAEYQDGNEMVTYSYSAAKAISVQVRHLVKNSRPKPHLRDRHD